MNETTPELSIVLPAYEEARNLDVLLPQLHEAVRSFGVPYEIIVVDAEQPRDDTPSVCERHSAVYQPRSGGELYGHAIRTALQVARGRYLILMDADGSHSPTFVPKLWEQRESADMVIASRYVQGGRTDNPAVLILMSQMVNVVFRLVLGLNCADVSNSFRLYRGDDVRSLQLECDNFDIVEEILVKLVFSRPGFRLKEVPFVFEKRKAGKTKRKLVAFAIGYVGTLLRLHRLKRKATRGKSRQA
ncbi:MAG: glycosyltransferase [Chthoniobacterales bacterium]